MACRRLELTNSFIYLWCKYCSVQRHKRQHVGGFVKHRIVQRLHGHQRQHTDHTDYIRRVIVATILPLQYYHFLAAERSESGSMNILRVFLLLLFKDYGSAEFSGF